MSDLSDEELWQLVVSGDSRSYGVIWDRHRDRVFRHLIGEGNPGPDAEDLSAAVFLELWRRRSSVRFVDGSVLPWLIVTARNVHRNSSRARLRYKRFLANLPPPADVPDHAVRVAELNDPSLSRLREIVGSARPVDAQLLAMTALEGFSIREAAAAVGLTEGAAKMRLSRLRDKLRADLKPLLIIEGGA